MTVRRSFQAFALYSEPQESMKGFLSKRWSFWLALFSCVAFLIGNMVGQHGWGAFWKSVWGKEVAIEVPYEGMTVPIQKVPNPDLWSPMKNHEYGFSDVPNDVFVPLPQYQEERNCGEDVELDRRVYSTRYLGDYDGGGDFCGSHPDVDILVPEGTPVVAIANGIIERVDIRSWGFGNSIVLKVPHAPHPDEPEKTMALFASYGHLGKILVTQGDVVRKGQHIGFTGKTGNATAPHLDFQIAKETAPFYPYWPFTTSEASNAGYDFVGAVNNGLGRELGKEYTVSPIAYIQAHPHGTAEGEMTVSNLGETREQRSFLTATADRKSNRLSRLPKAETPVVESVAPPQEPQKGSIKERVIARVRSFFAARRENRVAERMTRQQNRPSQESVALHSTSNTEPVPSPIQKTEGAVQGEEILDRHLQPLVVGESTASSADEGVSTAETDIPMPKAKGEVAEITMLHDGEFSDDWEQIVLFARDREGRFMRMVSFDGELRLGTTFGDAEFSPAVLTEEQFDDRGRAIIRMMPRKDGRRSIVPVISGAFSVRGEPLAFNPAENSELTHSSHTTEAAVSER